MATRTTKGTKELGVASLSSKEILRILRAELKPVYKIQSPEPGYKTTKQWAAEFGLRKSSTTDILNKAARKGLVAVKRFTIIRACGRPLDIPHYAWVSKK